MPSTLSDLYSTSNLCGCEYSIHFATMIHLLKQDYKYTTHNPEASLVGGGGGGGGGNTGVHSACYSGPPQIRTPLEHC